MANALDIIAGPRALAILRDRGFRMDDVDVFAAASGGPKWLVLAGFDRVLFAHMHGEARSRPLDCIGSSIGSWRLACLAQRDPVGAVDRFEDAYIEQRYTPHPTIDEVSSVGEGILDALLGAHGDREVVSHPWARLHIITTLCRGALATEHRATLLSAVALAAAGNLVWRRTLGWAMRRTIFHTAGDDSPFRGLADLPTTHLPLTERNVRSVVMASGSIPLVMRGVKIPVAPAGIYRDGGMIDYHPDLHFGPGDGIVLYPHFFPHVIPGWFDKALPWRRSSGENLDRALIIAPSAEFVATLPGQRIPDRNDFRRMGDADRIRAWREVTKASSQLGDELGELLASGRWAARVKPLQSDSRTV